MKYHSGEQFTLYNGNSKQILPTLPENSIDSIVTDPPYELGFMGKSWDSTGVANDVDLWKEVLRVLKPGGYLLSFGGSRTYHRMAVAIEDAGFEIRDQIMWVYGSGFPKSHNISKGLDKQEGIWRGRAGEVKTENIAMSGPNYKRTLMQPPSTPAAKQWDGWGTALKPAHEPIVLARKPFTGTVVNNVLTYGVGGINIDEARVGSEGGTTGSEHIPNNTPIYGKGLGNTGEVVSLNAGRWPANFIHDGSDEVVELFPDTKNGTARVGKPGGSTFGGTVMSNEVIGTWYGDSGSAARFFYCAKAGKRDRNEGLDGFEEVQITGGGGLTAELRKDGSLETASAGGKYGSIKAKKANHHPTVKPTDLMQYLCRLITPPNGTILDPFLGSGSTGKAAMYEGFKFVGIELTDEYLPIAKARIEFALSNLDEKLF